VPGFWQERNAAGDLMLEGFVCGEASSSLIELWREEKLVGGSGNLVRNLAGLGARCRLVGMIGVDEARISSPRRSPPSTYRPGNRHRSDRLCHGANRNAGGELARDAREKA
jgi:hypothetical protein